MLFSQRKGYKPLGKTLQTDSMDEELRNGLWSSFHFCYLEQHDARFGNLSGSNLGELFIQYWYNFFKYPVDNLALGHISGPAKEVRNWFFKSEWYEAYDFLEFTIKNGPEGFADDFRSMANDVLERENSGYRFVNSKEPRSKLRGIKRQKPKGLSGVNPYVAV